MKKQLIFILVVIAIAVIYYYLTPKQTRLGDDYQPENLLIQDEEQSLFDNQVNKKIEDLKIYYYKSDDINCETLIAITPENFDNRYKYKEINAITTLLSGKVPQGYKSAIINGTVLNQLTIRQGVATVDVSTFLTLGTGKCSTKSRINQISQTLLQFEDIKDIVFLTDGNPIK